MEQTANDQGSQQDSTGTVAIIGIGLMGDKVARRLKSQGFDVLAWNRSTEACSKLVDAGIEIAASVSEAVQHARIVLLLLSDAGAIEATLLREDVQDHLKNKVIVQMGTIGPDQSRGIAEAIRQAGGDYIEAPVLGSQPEAEKGTLLVMVGWHGNPEQSTAWPVLRCLGQKPTYVGDVGSAAAVKLALNQLIASLTLGFSTSLALLQRNKVDIDKFMDILRPSALYAPTFDKKLQRMLDRDYANPNFPTKHLLKDVELFANEADLVGLDRSLLDAYGEVIRRTISNGLDFTDYSAVHEGICAEDELCM